MEAALESLAGFVSDLVSLGRSSRFDLRRHAALRGAQRLRDAEAVRGSGPGADARRGRLARLAGRDASAESSWASALAREPALPEALAWRWELSASAGGRDDSDLDRALAARPDRAAWRAWRGLRRLAARRDPGADLRRAAEAGGFPAVQARAGLALAAARARRWRRALSELDAAVALAPREGWLRRLRAKTRLRAGDEPGFVADCHAENLLDEGIGTFAQAFGESARSSPPALLRRVDAALRGRPGVWWMLALRGDCRVSPEVGDREGGLADLEEAARRAPRPGWLLGHVARARLALGDEARAAEAMDAAVAAERRCGWLRAWRGALRARLGDGVGALAEYDAAERLDPDYDLLYLWRAKARRAAGRAQEALADLELAAGLTPARQEAWAQRADLLRELGRTAEAAACDRRARDYGGGRQREIEAVRRSSGPPPGSPGTRSRRS
jgi:tetratricopeptide (TPR) repeat protein